MNAFNAEETTFHCRIQKTTLAPEEARAYWSRWIPDVSKEAQAIRAFEERWFGARSAARVRILLESLRARFDRFPEAFEVLRGWRGMDARVRGLICHWHLQLSDPLYRGFTGDFLPARRSSGAGPLDRGQVLRWVAEVAPGRWGPSSRVQFTSKLMTAASEAGLLSPRRDPRLLLGPPVPDLALAYLLQLLAGIAFEGTLLQNPYLASVGLTGPLLEDRLRSLQGFSVRRLGDVVEFDREASSLRDWAAAALPGEAA